VQLLAKRAESSHRPSNALLAMAVEVCCQRGVTHLTYGRYTYGNKTHSTLTDFKRRNGFQCIRFPRYFVPLTGKGKAAMAFKLHLGREHLVPSRLMDFLLNARAAYYARYPGSRGSTQVARQSEVATGVARLTGADREHGANRRDHPQGLE